MVDVRNFCKKKFLAVWCMVHIAKRESRILGHASKKAVYPKLAWCTTVRLPGLRRSDGCIPREVDESTRELKVSKGTAITININVWFVELCIFVQTSDTCTEEANHDT